MRIKVEMLLLKAAVSKPYVEELNLVLMSYGNEFDSSLLSAQLWILKSLYLILPNQQFELLLQVTKCACY